MIDLAVEVACALARRFEGCRLRPYLCSAGVPTIGFGATYYENGSHVTLFDPPITAARAEELLLWMVRTKYLPAVIRQCPAINDPMRLAAIIDFTFNLGEGNLRASTMRRRINAEDWGLAREECLKWIRGGGRVLPGLIVRRATEARMM